VRLFILARHGQTVLNVERLVNGDPTLAAPLTPEGEQAARALGHEVANVPLELCVHTRFPRTRQTAQLALESRDVPFLEEPLLDDIDVGELEGRTIDDYRAWKAAHDRRDRCPGGESRDGAAARYARGFRGLLARPERSMLVVCHEIPIRYALNAASGSDDLDGPEHGIPNATPFLFDELALERAAARIETRLEPAPGPA
jgi:broad specificity phosphatase PhoE